MFIYLKKSLTTWCDLRLWKLDLTIFLCWNKPSNTFVSSQPFSTCTFGIDKTLIWICAKFTFFIDLRASVTAAFAMEWGYVFYAVFFPFYYFVIFKFRNQVRIIQYFIQKISFFQIDRFAIIHRTIHEHHLFFCLLQENNIFKPGRISSILVINFHLRRHQQKESVLTNTQ
jgi:hypothetical protein